MLYLTRAYQPILEPRSKRLHFVIARNYPVNFLYTSYLSSIAIICVNERCRYFITTNCIVAVVSVVDCDLISIIFLIMFCRLPATVMLNLSLPVIYLKRTFPNSRWQHVTNSWKHGKSKLLKSIHQMRNLLVIEKFFPVFSFHREHD